MLRISVALGILLSILAISCDEQSRYQELVERELAKESRNDSLFLGYHFGMTRQEFFDHSWKLNNQKIVMQGNRTASIRYDLDHLKYRAQKNFYPEFYDGKIYKMPVRYMYNGWAPWNRDYWADSLKKDVLADFREKYPNRFYEMSHPELEVPAHIMVDKNKRIAIYELDNKEVVVDYADLSVLNQIKDEE
ncbi:MAG: hypothetical protein R3222_05470 [Balneolaceae bacterium]|nr:hypothetical protein [Balneolaceae bacterium]